MITPDELKVALQTSPKAAHRMSQTAIEQYDAEINQLAKWRKEAEEIRKQTAPKEAVA